MYEKSLPGGKLPFAIFLLGPAKPVLRNEIGGAAPLQTTWQITGAVKQLQRIT